MLGIALNLSVFYYEVLGDQKMGKALVEETLEMAEDNLDKSDEKTYKEAKHIIQLLKDNYNDWSQKWAVEEEENQGA